MRFLASVMNAREARLCLALGADIIDAKDATAGALGALPLDEVRAIRAAVGAPVQVSATTGDPTDDAGAIVGSVRAMASTGVDYVKVGLDGGDASRRALALLKHADLKGARLVGVFLADRGIDLSLIAAAQAAGFAGVMLDTADKRRGALPDLIPAATLSAFLAAAQRAGLFAGLAGSLQARHVAELVPLGPDVLGFRGGLCCEHNRTREIDDDAVSGVRHAIDAAVAAECVPKVERVPKAERVS
jgi:uncharacterized protein (UPF0264 family)